MKYLIIGTAGHVDHGKTALVKALTGTDTDRLQEEKSRGISVDLGFALLSLSDEIKAGIVDVPGHERFLKNMLAGTGGIDLALIVVAGDEGVMPQTREHLAMLSLYGIKHGVVAINKADKVDKEWLKIVEEDIRTILADTSFSDAPICRVSALTGEGLPELWQLLLNCAQKVPARDGRAPFRLWIDRAFIVKGHGTVITGTVISGTAAVGDNYCLYPEGANVRIRGLETHGEKVSVVYAGQRAAINLADVELEDLRRGMFISHCDRGQISTTWDVMVNWRKVVASGTRVRLHIGTGEYMGRIFSYKGTDEKYMRLLLESPLAAGSGDKGIMRLYSPQELVGGVTLVAPSEKSRKISVMQRRLGDALYEDDIPETLYQKLAAASQPISIEAIRRQSGYVSDIQIASILNNLVANDRVERIDEYYLAKERMESIKQGVASLLSEFHRQQPEKLGLSQTIIKQKLALGDKLFDRLVNHWQSQKVLVLINGELALPSHTKIHSAWAQKLGAKAELVLGDIGLTPVTVTLLAEKFLLPDDEARMVLKNFIREGVLIKVAEMYVYRKTIQNIIGLIHRYFQEHSTISVAELRDMLNTSRKVAVPILEYLDVHKYTYREGDLHRPSQRIRDFSE